MRCKRHRSLCLENRKGPIPQKQPHQETDQIHHSPGMGKRPLSCLKEGNQYTEHKTFRAGAEGAASTHGRQRAAPPGVSLALQEGPLAACIPWVAYRGEGCYCPSPEVRHAACQLGGTSGTQDFHPTDRSLCAGDGPAVVRAGEELQHPQIPARAVSTSSRSHPYPHQQQSGPIPLQGAGQRGERLPHCCPALG